MASTENIVCSFLLLLSIFMTVQCIGIIPNLVQIHKNLAEELKPILGKIQNTQCKNDVSAFLHGVKNYDLWAMQMLDASGKWNSGFLRGNIKILGSYDQCLVTEEPKLEIRGQYCVANLEVTTENEKIDGLLDVATLKRRDREMTTNRSRLNVPDVFPSMSLIQYGVCVPASCTLADIESSLSEIFNKTEGLNVISEIESCYTKEKKFKLNQNAISFIIVVILIFLLVTVSSAVECGFGRHSGKGFLYDSFMAFSLPNNWLQLKKISHSPTNLKCLDGIRILSTLWVVLGHKFTYTLQEPCTNKIFQIESIKSFVMATLVNNTLSVETFFLVSGLLRAYNLMKEFDENSYNYFTDFFRRYLRLTPVHALVIAFYATLLPSLGSGPRWNLFITESSDGCIQNWINNILYINNYGHYDKQCLLQAWYLATDMQLFLLAPIFVYIFWKNPAAGKIVLFFLGAIPVAYTAWFTYSRHELSTIVLGASDEQLLSFHKNVQFKVRHRMAPYVVGLGLGYLMHTCKNVRLSWLTAVSGWTICFATFYAIFIAGYNLVQFDYEYDPIEAALFAGLHRVSWAFAVAWLIFACNNSCGGWITDVLSLNVFQPLSKISYCIYLTHNAILMIGAARVQSPLFVDEYNFIHDFLGDLVMCISVATILYLTVEAPLSEITKQFFAKSKNAAPKKSE